MFYMLNGLYKHLKIFGQRNYEEFTSRFEKSGKWDEIEEKKKTRDL